MVFYFDGGWSACVRITLMMWEWTLDVSRICDPDITAYFLKHGRSGAESSLDKIESHFFFLLE